MTDLATGSPEDAVRLELNGDDIFIAEGWEVLESVLATPGCFSLDLGQSTPLTEYFTDPSTPVNSSDGTQQRGAKYPPGVPFKLYVGSALQMVGVYEGFHVSGAAAKISLKGRDGLAALHRAHSELQRSFTDGTYTDLVQWALEQAGYAEFDTKGNVTKRNYTLIPSNAANRQIKAGVPLDEISAPLNYDDISAAGTQGADGAGASATLVGGVTSQQHQNRISENLLAFCRRHLDRAGLFLWAAAETGVFILSQPNGSQKPALRIERRRGAAQANSNIVDMSYTFDFTNRHGACAVYGRGGGAKAGRVKAKGAFRDEEVTNYGLAYGANWGQQPALARDVNVQSIEQAEFYARRKLAEERRAGWNLTYTISGHRLPTDDGSGGWGVVTPDTCVRIIDDNIGLNDIYYVESVRRMRKPQTVTEVRFMRIEDLIFANAETG